MNICAAQCNAQRELPPAQLVQQIIEAATEHADILGCGFRDLQTTHMAWVLSRLAFEVSRLPRVLEELRITTWIENFNRHFSQRNFEIVSGGEPIGYARTIWIAIDIDTRRPASIERFTDLAATACDDRPCPIAPPAKLRAVAEPGSAREYIFRVSDIDFNRHVNSARYVELMLNSLALETFDTHTVKRFDIDFKHEAHFADVAEVGSKVTEDDNGTLTMDCDITVAETLRTLSRTILTPRK